MAPLAMPTPQRPPPGARTYYKVVCVVNTSPLRFISIYDGRTQYRLDATTSPAGGCWVCPDLLQVVRHSSTLPSRSARLHAPRAILQVLGWNSGGVAPTVSPAHGSQASKLLVSHVHPVAVLPYTAAGQPGTAAGQEEALSDGIATLSSNFGSRPRSAPPPRPPELQVTSGQAARTYGGTLERGQRLQAMTAGLHEDVLLASARLQRIQSINGGAAARSAGAGDGVQRDWVRRALARSTNSGSERVEPAPSPRVNVVRAA